jgi:hypothetical protein
MAEKPLFERGAAVLDSETKPKWRINVDSLTDADIDSLARLAVERVGHFGHVEPVHPGGARLADALRRYATRGPLLIVDDILTTGTTLEAQREGREAVGVVIFAMGPCPVWVKPIFVAGKEVESARTDLDELKKRLFTWAPSRAPDALAAVESLAGDRNHLLIEMERMERRASLVDEAAQLLREWRRDAEHLGEAPLAVRAWLARYESLDGHDGC